MIGSGSCYGEPCRVMLDFPSHDHIAVDLFTMNDFQTRTEVEYAPGLLIPPPPGSLPASATTGRSNHGLRRSAPHAHSGRRVATPASQPAVARPSVQLRRQMLRCVHSSPRLPRNGMFDAISFGTRRAKSCINPPATIKPATPPHA